MMGGLSWVSAASSGGAGGGARFRDKGIVDESVARKAAGSSPVVGVSGARSESDSVQAMLGLLSASGAVPLLLVDHGNRIPLRDIEAIDGLVVMGNDFDINPAAYGQEPHPTTRSELFNSAARRRAVYETDMIRLAFERDMPLVGICGGMHRLNVIQGGDLIQHLPDILGHDRHEQLNAGIPISQPVADIAVIPGGLLHQVLGASEGRISENSCHHQAVGRVGDGLRVAAYVEEKLPSDGSSVRVVEAVEPHPKGGLAGSFVLGLQWHPEFRASFTGKKIAEAVVDAASGFAFSSLARATAPQSSALSDVRKASGKTICLLGAAPVRDATMGVFLVRASLIEGRAGGVGARVRLSNSLSRPGVRGGEAGAFLPAARSAFCR